MRSLSPTFFHRDPTANKYDFGHVLVIGGSPGMVGALFLAAQAALRTGAGLVTIASTPEVIDKLEKRAVEIMTLRVPAEPEAFVRTVKEFVHARHVNALVIGPGQTPPLTDMSIQLLGELSVPVVVDGGALGALQGKLAHLKALAAKNHGIILTPHAGEYEKLAGRHLAADASANQQAAVAFAVEQGVILVLKGHGTIVAHPDGTTARNTTGNPGLATAGAGDVLSGVIAGLLAQGLVPADATEIGVYLHGLAGDLAAAAKTQAGMIASDVIAQLPYALKSLSKEAE